MLATHNIIETFRPSPKMGAKRKRIVDPHRLKSFFRSRGIPYKRLAAHFERTTATISLWFSGRVEMSEEIQREMARIEAAILKWEKDNGRRWSELAEGA